MTEPEKLSMTKKLIDIASDDTSADTRILAYLTLAEKEILGWRYSYGSAAPTSVPTEYEMTQVMAVVAGYTQSGAEGQTTHGENGISRTFKYADMIAYIRANVIPFAGVVC